jgi:hypothetical protein
MNEEIDAMMIESIQRAEALRNALRVLKTSPGFNEVRNEFDSLLNSITEQLTHVAKGSIEEIAIRAIILQAQYSLLESLISIFNEPEETIATE